MASEAAVLGTQAIFMLSLLRTLFNLKEPGKNYGLLFSFCYDQEEKCLATINSLVDMKNPKEIWVAKRAKMLEDKIDVAD